MAEKTKLDGTSAPRRGVRWGRIFWTLVVLGVLAGGAYGASWLNARRYYLIVDTAEVRIERGRMFPVGHEPFSSTEPELTRAYASFPLPGGINLPRGETTFTERIELDQALYRLLKDAVLFSLEADNRRTTELVQRYLKQLKAIPGASVAQQLELAGLDRREAYHEAKERLADGLAALRDAARLFRESARGEGAREHDGEWRARAIEGVLDRVNAPGFGTPGGAASGADPAHTSTVASSTTTRGRVP